MGLILRRDKGYKLTNDELDDNLVYLERFGATGSTGPSGSSGSSGSSGISGDIGATGSSGLSVFPIGLAASDETTALTVGISKITFRMPFTYILTEVRANLMTPQTSGDTFTVDINESGTSILSTKLTIDNTQKTSITATYSAVISNSSLTDDAEITVDIDQIGDGTATGLKIWLIGSKT